MRLGRARAVWKRGVDARRGPFCARCGRRKAVCPRRRFWTRCSTTDRSRSSRDRRDLQVASAPFMGRFQDHAGRHAGLRRPPASANEQRHQRSPGFQARKAVGAESAVVRSLPCSFEKARNSSVTMRTDRVAAAILRGWCCSSRRERSRSAALSSRSSKSFAQDVARARCSATAAFTRLVAKHPRFAPHASVRPRVFMTATRSCKARHLETVPDGIVAAATQTAEPREACVCTSG